MTESEFDRIMAADENIVPSSGFAESVMDVVRREAAIPKPIPFPWLRAVLGLVALAITMTLIVIFSQAGSTTAGGIRGGPPPELDSVLHVITSPVAIWTGFVLVLTFASLELSTRFCGGKT